MVSVWIAVKYMLNLLFSVEEKPVGSLVVVGGGTDEDNAPVVLGPLLALDGCPLVLDGMVVVYCARDKSIGSTLPS